MLFIAWQARKHHPPTFHKTRQAHLGLKHHRSIHRTTAMNKPRKDHEPPAATGEWGWRFHHIGIPTRQPILGETYLPAFRLGVGGFDTSPFGIEWMRYEEDSPVDELIQTVPHIAFEVDDLDLELERHSFHILTPPNAPSSGVRVAMIEHNGAPVELIEFAGNKHK